MFYGYFNILTRIVIMHALIIIFYLFAFYLYFIVEHIKYNMFTKIPRYNRYTILRLRYLSQFYIQVNKTYNTMSIVRISRGIKKNRVIAVRVIATRLYIRVHYTSNVFILIRLAETNKTKNKCMVKYSICILIYLIA